MQNTARVPYIIAHVQDLESSERFYRQLFGKAGQALRVAAGAGEKALAIRVQGTTLLLIQKDGFTAERSTTQAFPVFEVARLSAFHNHAKRYGVECVQEPGEAEDGLTAIYRDPDGLLLIVTEPAQHHGLVFSGGGAYGAFELGVVKALASERRDATGEVSGPVFPMVMSGTSVGAYNAAYLACALGDRKELGHAVDELTEIWRGRVAGGLHDNGVFRLRGDISRWPGIEGVMEDAAFLAREAFARLAYAVTPPPLVSRVLHTLDISTMFSVAPLRSLIEETIHWQALCKSPSQLRIATTDWKDGKVTLFGHGCSNFREMVTEDNLRDAILASTAIPGIFPPVDVTCTFGKGCHVRSYVDGGLLMNSPLNPAIDAGATVIHLVCLNPEVNKLPLQPISGTLSIIERALVTTVAGHVDSDLERARLVNKMAGVVQRKHSEGYYRPLTVHRYHPSTEVLGGLSGILDFSKGHLNALIQDGIDCVLNHDCKQAKCVRPM